MFIGEYSHTIDEKNRVAMPSKFREELGGKVILTRGLDFCLFAYPLETWENLAKRLNSLSLGDPESRGFVRIMLAGASDVSVDRQGRVLVPEYLKSYATLSRNIVVSGIYNRMEIWDAARWTEYKARMEKDTDALAKKLGEAGLY